MRQRPAFVHPVTIDGEEYGLKWQIRRLKVHGVRKIRLLPAGEPNEVGAGVEYSAAIKETKTARMLDDLAKLPVDFGVQDIEAAKKRHKPWAYAGLQLPRD